MENPTQTIPPTTRTLQIIIQSSGEVTYLKHILNHLPVAEVLIHGLCLKIGHPRRWGFCFRSPHPILSAPYGAQNSSTKVLSCELLRNLRFSWLRKPAGALEPLETHSSTSGCSSRPFWVMSCRATRVASMAETRFRDTAMAWKLTISPVPKTFTNLGVT